MSTRSSISSIAASLLAACVATALVAPAAATTPEQSFIPFLPPILLPFPLIERPIQQDCDIDPSPASWWYVNRDVRVSNYDGWSLESAKFMYRASVTGTYTFKLTVRETDRSGHMIVQSTEKTLNLTANTPVDGKTFFGNAYVGRATTLSISHTDVVGPSNLFFGKATGSCATSKLTDTDGTIDAATTAVDVGFELRGDEDHYTNNVVEYYIVSLQKYFVTAHANDQAALDTLPDFQRTGRSFRMPKKSAYTNIINVYRFFSPEAVTHVYVDKSGHDIIVANPAFGLNDEGIDFGSIKPDYSIVATGVCPTWAPVKINRSFHNTATVNQRNHRYTNNTNDYNDMTANGWAPEGAAFCAYSATFPGAL